jgi:hypothetical protein
LPITINLVSSTSKADCHDITEILLKVALNPINQTKPNLNSEENFSHSGGQHIFSVYIFEVRIIAKTVTEKNATKNILDGRTDGRTDERKDGQR